MVTKKKKAEKARARAERENRERKRQEEEARKAYLKEHPEAAEEVVEEELEEVGEAEDVVPPKNKHYIWLAIISVPVAICCDLGQQPFIALVMAAVALGVYRYNQIMYENEVASRVPFWCGVACIVLAVGGWLFMALPALMGGPTS